MGTFDEAKAKLRAGVKKGKNGNDIHSFSKTDFNDLVNALLNDPDHQMETVKLVDGELTNVTTPVVAELREKLFVPILQRGGMDKADAQDLAKTFHFNGASTSNMYEFVSEALYNYLDAGKKFNFPNRKTFCGSVYFKDVDENVVVRDIRDIKDHKTIMGHKKDRQEAHKTIVKKSTCPTWLRHVL